MVSEEELKGMSPEQIAELQKQNCIFCHIISGRVQSKKVYEDDKSIAILDINPANPGHMLLIPKEHYTIMPLVPEDVLGHMFMVAKALSTVCLKALQAKGTNIFVANGAIAGQKAPHFMIHVIPRQEKDGLNFFNLQHKQISPGDQEQVWIRLKQKVNDVFGIKEEIQQETPEQVAEQLEQRRENIVEADFTDLDKISSVLKGGRREEQPEEDELPEAELEDEEEPEEKGEEPEETEKEPDEEKEEAEEEEKDEESREEETDESDEEKEGGDEAEELDEETEDEEKDDDSEEGPEDEEPESTNLDKISRILFKNEPR